MQCLLHFVRNNWIWFTETLFQIPSGRNFPIWNKKEKSLHRDIKSFQDFRKTLSFNYFSKYFLVETKAYDSEYGFNQHATSLPISRICILIEITPHFILNYHNISWVLEERYKVSLPHEQETKKESNKQKL